MLPEIGSRVRLLKQVLIFNEFDENELAEVAKRLKEQRVAAGETVFREGDEADRLFIVASGKLDVFRTGPEGEEIFLARFERGDTFGEEGLYANQPRSATIQAITPTELFYLDDADFRWLRKTYPQVNPYLLAFRQTYEAARQLNIRWLGDGETISLISRRHPIRMISEILITLLVMIVLTILLVSSAFFLAGREKLVPIALIIGGINSLISLGISGWIYAEWRNDYLFVTNVRVVWRERIILRSASQQEVPLRTIQSLDVRTSNVVERLVKTGALIIRTFNSEMYLTEVRQPQRMKNMINGFLRRTQRLAARQEREAIRQVIRDRLNLPKIEALPEIPERVPPVIEERPHPLALFKTRVVEENGAITYRKHWSVFLRSAWLPLLGVLLMVVSMPWMLPFLVASRNILFFLVAATIAFIPAASLIYKYADWRNDIYRLTKDRIIDREKRPLGAESFRSAPLKNIQSVRHEIPGPIGLLLNVGTVRINVGDDTLVFHGVHNPALVHQDISRRMEALIAQQERERIAQEHDRMATWLEIYHDQVKDLHPSGGDHEPDFS